MKKKMLLVLFFIVAIAINVYTVPLLWSTNSKTYIVGEDVIAKIDVDEEKPASTTNVIEDLQEEYSNDDIVGVLSIKDTDYNTIVTQSSDNSFYLNHDSYGNKDRNGTPFLDYRVDINNSQKLLIYAHNSRYRSMPFEILENYYDESYYKEHDTLYLETSEGTKTYKIFSVYVETSDFDYYDVNYSNKTTWYNHLKKLKNNSMYDTGVEIDEDSNILILQTCSTLSEYSSFKHKFLVVIGVEV